MNQDLRSLPVAPKLADSEKTTINLGFVDLGQVDLMVAEGFYGNRADFIRTAIRNQLTTHAQVVQEVVARKMLVLGLQHFSVDDLRALQAAHQTLQIRVLGLVTIALDVSPELALACRYKLYQPPGLAGKALPLVVMLHGCTQDADDFAAGTGMNERAREQGLFVLYPQQGTQANPSGCWNWFEPQHQQRGRGHLVGRPRQRVVHRCERPRCHAGDVAFLF